MSTGSASLREVRAAVVATIRAELGEARCSSHPVERLTTGATPETGVWAVSLGDSAAIQDGRQRGGAQQRDTDVLARCYLPLTADRSWGDCYDAALDECGRVERALYALCATTDTPHLGVSGATTRLSDPGTGRYIEATVTAQIRHRWRAVAP